MQLHGVSLELLDGIPQIFVGAPLLLGEGYIVFRLAGHVKTAVLEGDTLLQPGSLHDARRGPKQ